MFPSYTANHMCPGGFPTYPLFPYMSMPMFPSQAPLSTPSTPPSANVTSLNNCISPDEGNISASSSECSSGYSSFDSTNNSPAFPTQYFRPGPFSCYPVSFPFWPQPSATSTPMTGFPPRPSRVPTPEGTYATTCNPFFTQGYPPSPIIQRSGPYPRPGWMVPYGFSPQRMVPPRVSTPLSVCMDSNIVSPIPSEKSKTTPEKNTLVKRCGRPQKRKITAALKSQRAFAMLELIVDLLMNDTNMDIIEWISTNSLEFTVRDRKKFIEQWNRISGKHDSFLAISCVMRAVGNEHVVTIYGQKVRLITRTAAYTYRFFPDHDLPSIPILRDDDLQQLLTKLLLSFHLHLNRNKKVIDSNMFTPTEEYPMLPSHPSPTQPETPSEKTILNET